MREPGTGISSLNIPPFKITALRTSNAPSRIRVGASLFPHQAWNWPLPFLVRKCNLTGKKSPDKAFSGLLTELKIAVRKPGVICRKEVTQPNFFQKAKAGGQVPLAKRSAPCPPAPESPYSTFRSSF